MRPAPHYAPQIGTAAARAQLAVLLAGARSLDGFTDEGLAATHRVRRGEVEVMLEKARARRVGDG